MPGDDLPLPLRERIAMRVEHMVDTKLVQLAIWMLRSYASSRT